MARKNARALASGSLALTALIAAIPVVLSALTGCSGSGDVTFAEPAKGGDPTSTESASPVATTPSPTETSPATETNPASNVDAGTEPTKDAGANPSVPTFVHPPSSNVWRVELTLDTATRWAWNYARSAEGLGTTFIQRDPKPIFATLDSAPPKGAGKELFQCGLEGQWVMELLVTTDPKCEWMNKQSRRSLGFIYDEAQPGTVQLHRCTFTMLTEARDSFVTLDPAAECKTGTSAPYGFVLPPK